MRDFFIRGFEAILSILLILGAVGIVIAAGVAAFGNASMEGAPAGMSGPVAGLAILIVGFVGLIVYGGLLYLGLGIYHNTRRTAEALEARGGRV
jgi:hypothetical protein